MTQPRTLCPRDRDFDIAKTMVKLFVFMGK